jgi:hypothetical protein
MNRYKTQSRAAALLVTALLIGASPFAHAQTCPFDDGNSSLAVEGLILTRYALGITGAPLVMSTGINAADASTVEAAINCPSCGLNITGNATLTVADATIISRKLAGFSGDALTANLDLGNGTRNTPAAVQSFLLAGCGATGGTVTSITAGTGLTGGTITGSGTVGLASTQLLPTTACATDQIAKWNGNAWVCSAASPTLPTCMLGQVIRVGIGGLLQCGNLPNSFATHRQGTDSIGLSTAIAIGSDALPVVAYYNATDDSVRVLKCSNAACTSGNTDSLLEVTGVATPEISVAIPADNLPIISYHRTVDSSLRVAKCGNASCSSGNTITTVDNAGTVGRYSSVVIPPDGRPAISYADSTNGALKMVKCGNAACSNGNAFSFVDTVSAAFTSIALSADGFPVIAYRDNANVRLKVAKCADANCTTSSKSVVDDTAASVGSYASIALPADGRPIISYQDFTNLQLKVARCGNAACSASNVRTIIDAAQDGGWYSSIAIGADGFAVVSYHDTRSPGTLKFVKCGNATCSTSVNRIISTVDGGDGANVGTYSALAMPADGLPVISYRDSTNGTLKIVKCSNAACVFP